MSSEQASPSSQPDVDPGFHNSVLTRTHEPARSGNHSWMMIVPLVVVLIAGAAFWVYASGHPGQAVNHPVAQAANNWWQ